MSETTVLEDPALGERFRITEFADEHPERDDGADVIAGLTGSPKTLPARYFYDDHGSDLFERITVLPEYYLTRTEEAILRASAAKLAARTGECDLIELGSGSSAKTRTLISAYVAGGHHIRYLPIDISAGILKPSAEALIADFPTIEVWGLVGTYERALKGLPPRNLPRSMAVFLGSTLGNMSDQEIDAFLAQVRGALDPGEYFLVGTDLHKPRPVVEAAYNDTDGVTAQFNLNMLRHLNRRFAGDFDLANFKHVAFYNEPMHRIEMHLESLDDQTVELAGLGLTVDFSTGETVRTEISRKFHLPTLTGRFKTRGFEPVETWTDANDYFALTLFSAV